MALVRHYNVKFSWNANDALDGGDAIDHAS
jgi:hypothetical protein